MNKRTPFEWFRIWYEIILCEGEVSPLELSRQSKSSLWTIRGLKRDFMEMYPNIRYNERLRKFYDESTLHTLTTLSPKEKDDLK